MDGQGETGDGLALVVRPDFSLNEQVDNAECQQNGQCNDAVGAAVLEGRARQEYQANDGTDAEEHGISADVPQGTELNCQ